MLMLLVGILFLANMAQTGRTSYEEILIKAKNNQLTAPDDPSVKFAGQYSLFINVTIGCQNVALVNLPNCHVFGLFLFCYEHSGLLVWHKRSQTSLLLGFIHCKFLSTDILFIFYLFMGFTNYYAAMHLVIVLYLLNVKKFHMGDQFLYLFIKFSIIDFLKHFNVPSLNY